MGTSFKRCNYCVMDNSSDDTITFDEFGQCNYCKEALFIKNTAYFPNGVGQKKLRALIEKIKLEGKNKKYDCIMGLSGGLDSSYLAFLGKKWGLRVLAIHIDDGYDTEISKANLKRLLDYTGFDFEIIKPDKEQYNDLLLSYMKAGVPNIAIPQDNILFAFLYKKMKEYRINYFLSGGNFALESILQKGFTHKSSDVVNIKAIHKKYGTKGINKLKFISTIKKNIDCKLLKIHTERPLNLIEYNRERAFFELKQECGFEYYGRKHLENVFTAFVQLYWLPLKFGVDKRTSHLSSMIVSDQLSRKNALKELAEPICDQELMNRYIALIKENMHLNDEAFSELINSQNHKHEDFRTEDKTFIYKLLRFLK